MTIILTHTDIKEIIAILDRSSSEMPELVMPSREYKSSFLDAMEEFREEGKRPDPHSYPIGQTFEDFLTCRLNENTNPNPAHKWMPNSDYWLVEGMDFVGRFNLRHVLTDEVRAYGGHIGYEIRPSWRRQGYGRRILQLGLFKAREHGFDRVLVTCNSDNTPSRRIIESLGGHFENAVLVPNSFTQKLRYWMAVVDSNCAWTS